MAGVTAMKYEQATRNINYCVLNPPSVSIVSRDNDEHGVLCKTRLHVGLFQRRYNGTYTQACGH